MRLLLIRHGETADNALRVIGSRPPGPPLSDLGLEQARAVAGRLLGERLVAVHSSRALRAVQTARTIAAGLAVPHVELDDLHEIDAGDLEGRPYADALADYAGTMQRWWTDPGARIPGGESGTEFMTRYTDAVHSLEAGGAETVAIVSHEAAMCVWASSTATNLDAAFSRTHGVRNTGVVTLEGTTAAGWTATSWDGLDLTS